MNVILYMLLLDFMDFILFLWYAFYTLDISLLCTMRVIISVQLYAHYGAYNNSFLMVFTVYDLLLHHKISIVLCLYTSDVLSISSYVTKLT
jgi:hypothetical protein